MDGETATRVIERVKELENRGYQFEAADGSFDLLIRKETGEYEPLFRLESWRAIVEKREDGRVETEATIKIWVDGERYVRTAEGNGPVNALDKALRARDRRALPAPARHRARELQGAHPRRAQGHGRGHARAARHHRRPGHLGRDRRVREHHRGELGRAGGLARGRHAARPHAALADARSRDLRDPAGSPGHRGARGGAGPRDAPLRPSLAWPKARRVRVRLRLPLGRRARLRRLLRHRRPPPRHPRGGRGGAATTWSPPRSASWPRRTACSTRAPGRCSATSTRARSTSPRRPPPPP